MYYLHYDETTGLIIGAPYHSAIHGKEVPVYNTEPIITELPSIDEDGNSATEEITQEPGTVQIGITIDLSTIPQPYTAITDAVHDDWMQHQSTRKIDIETKKLVEYTPPEPAPVIITPTTSQDLADVWEAIFALSGAKEGGI